MSPNNNNILIKYIIYFNIIILLILSYNNKINYKNKNINYELFWTIHEYILLKIVIKV